MHVHVHTRCSAEEKFSPEEKFPVLPVGEAGSEWWLFGDEGGEDIASGERCERFEFNPIAPDVANPLLAGGPPAPPP